jgi:hypothetical protein
MSVDSTHLLRKVTLLIVCSVKDLVPACTAIGDALVHCTLTVNRLVFRMIGSGLNRPSPQTAQPVSAVQSKGSCVVE